MSEDTQNIVKEMHIFRNDTIKSAHLIHPPNAVLFPSPRSCNLNEKKKISFVGLGKV